MVRPWTTSGRNGEGRAVTTAASADMWSGASQRVPGPPGKGRRPIVLPEREIHREDVRAERVQPEFERRHDAEVAAAPADPPVQVWMRVRAGGDDVAIGRDDLGGEDVVAGEPEPTPEVAVAATERQAADARMRDDAARGHEAMVLGLAIEIGQQRAPLDPRPAGGRIDDDGTHEPEVDDDATVRDRLAPRAMAAAADRDLELVGPREAHGRHHVRGAARPKDERWVLVDHAVPDAARSFVLGVRLAHDLAIEGLSQLRDRGVVEVDGVRHGVSSRAHGSPPSGALVLQQHAPEIERPGASQAKPERFAERGPHRLAVPEDGRDDEDAVRVDQAGLGQGRKEVGAAAELQDPGRRSP